MFSSANYVIFVNFEDFDVCIKNTIKDNFNNKITFFSGYDCDSLALENVTGFAKHILPLFEQYPEVDIEFRTKSVQREPFMTIKPMKNVIMAYSLMPDLMSSSLDNKAPSISKRIKVISDLALRGWKIGLRFDPLVYGKDWELLYEDLLEKVYNSISLESIHSVSLGPLRFPKKMFKNILKLYPEEPLFTSPLSRNKEIVSYDSKIEEEMSAFCEKVSLKYLDNSQIFKCYV
jgi:spore photoproduct lyase